MLAGVAVHVIQRGNNRGPCFFRHEDRAFYLFHLGRMLPRSRCSLHAYCLMTNHVHLLVTAEQPSGCGLLMKSIGQLYAQYVNKTYKRTGSLWEGRFKSCLVQSEEYVLACYRYIELNPVRADLARHTRGLPRPVRRAPRAGRNPGSYQRRIRARKCVVQAKNGASAGPARRQGTSWKTDREMSGDDQSDLLG